MPPKAKFSKEEVISTALGIVRAEGIKGLTARTLAKALNSSACPIFTLFNGMEQVLEEVLIAANKCYQAYLKEDMESGVYPPYKGSGMAYIRFAKEEKELFKLLFMRDRTGETIEEDRESVRLFLKLIQENLKGSEEEAYRFFLEMWIHVHGIATMHATSYLEWDMQFVSESLTDAYQGLLRQYKEKKNGCN